jgi:hypothetical protein
MIKDIILTLMIVSGIVGGFSPIIFREGGIIWGMTTRKGIIISALCLELMLILGGIAFLIDNSSYFLITIACVGGGTILLGIYFTVVYLLLPHARKKYLSALQEKERILNLIREKRENHDKVDDRH